MTPLDPRPSNSAEPSPEAQRKQGRADALTEREIEFWERDYIAYMERAGEDTTYEFEPEC